MHQKKNHPFMQKKYFPIASTCYVQECIMYVNGKKHFMLCIFSLLSIHTTNPYIDVLLSYVPPFSDFFSLFHTVYEQFCLLLLVYTFSFTVFDHAFRNINRWNASHLNGRSFTHSRSFSLCVSCKERWIFVKWKIESQKIK